MKGKHSAAWFLIAMEVIVLILVVVCVVLRWISPKQESGEWVERNTDTEMTEIIWDTEETEADTQSLAQEQTEEFSEEITAKLGEMTLEEKVAQMFLITPEALTGTDAVNAAGNATREAVNTYPVGGLVYSDVNFQGKTQVKDMLYRTQQFSMERVGTTMFFAVAGTAEETDSLLEISPDVNMVILPEGFDGDTVAYRENGIIPVVGSTSDDSRLVFSENLSEEEITSQYDAGEAAVAAVQSGADMLYLPADFKQAYQAVVDAVNDGTIPKEQIDQSVGRILTQKADLPEIAEPETDQENTQDQTAQNRQPASNTQNNNTQNNNTQNSNTQNSNTQNNNTQSQQTPAETPAQTPAETPTGPAEQDSTSPAEEPPEGVE